MGFGSLGNWGSDKLATLMGYINEDGSVMEEYRSEFSSIAGELNTLYTDAPITVSEGGYVQMDGVTYSSLSGFQTDYVNKAEKQTVAEYFGSYSYYCGVISNENSSAENFIKAICAATGCDMTYETTGGTCLASPTSTGQFYIQATAATNEEQAKVVLMGPHISVLEVPTLEVMANVSSANGLYLKYFIFRGKTGDCYAKFFYASDTTLPNIEEAETYFENISINAYEMVKTYVDDEETYNLEHVAMNYGGFALLLFERKVDGTGQHYDVAIFSVGGSPLVVGITSTSLASLDSTNQKFYRAITNNDAMNAMVAPVYSPSSGAFASKNSFWGIVSIKEGYYRTNVGSYYGATHVYDHGLLVEE